jgi:hypothetical protein
MSKSHPKAKHYTALLKKMSAAIAAEYYLEASWIAYAILEDRLVAVMLGTGGATEKNGNRVRMLGRKITFVRKRRRRDKLLGANFSKAWLNRLTRWKDQRNKLMHAMANATVSFGRIELAAKRLAIAGDPLVYDACRQTRRLKKHRSKIAVPKKPFPYNK